MSKQLLHACPPAVAVALGDAAYALLPHAEPMVAVELLPPTRDDVDGGDGKGGDAKKDGGGGNNKNDGGCAVDAVCATAIGPAADSTTWLAVSREDKTLCLYSRPSHASHANKAADAATSIEPTATYQLPKRAKRLAFASVPSAAAGGDACHVVIAGDAAGDAHAFPVPTSTDSASATSHARRLLLGHTASILTGLAIAPTTSDDGKGQLLLTADRDEKVRVSRFPETHDIHGYLLGNTSYISAMDAAVSAPSGDSGSGRALCVTGSGNGVVLLWDYETCKQVGMVPVVMTEEEELAGGEDRKRSAEEGVEDGEGEGEESKEDGEAMEDGPDDFDDEGGEEEDDQSLDGRAIATPLAVSLGPDAAHLVVARDGLSSIDVHPIPPPPATSSASTSLALSHLVSLHKKQTIECPSQPLAVQCLEDGAILALAREPPYLLHYRRSPDGDYEDVSSSSPFVAAIKDATKDRNVALPATNLETTHAEGRRHLHKGKGGEEEGRKRSGLHWNDGGRRDAAKEAERRRRKRRRDGARKGKAAEGC
ncbi:hypothetical protein ACHAXT_004221 [Thalassiosira profunda]